MYNIMKLYIFGLIALKNASFFAQIDRDSTEVYNGFIW